MVVYFAVVETSPVMPPESGGEKLRKKKVVGLAVDASSTGSAVRERAVPKGTPAISGWLTVRLPRRVPPLRMWLMAAEVYGGGRERKTVSVGSMRMVRLLVERLPAA